MLLFRLKVTSGKLMIFLFASMVIRSPLQLKIRQISFFILRTFNSSILGIFYVFLRTFNSRILRTFKSRILRIFYVLLRTFESRILQTFNGRFTNI